MNYDFRKVVFPARSGTLTLFCVEVTHTLAVNHRIKFKEYVLAENREFALEIMKTIKHQTYFTIGTATAVFAYGRV